MACEPVRTPSTRQRPEISWSTCRIPVRPFDCMVKAGQSACPQTLTGDVMKYLVAIHHPDDYDPFAVKDAAMDRDIDVLNEEMVAAGVRVFVGGLQHASKAKSIRVRPGGKVLITDGPYLETKEHVGGFWVLEAADLDEALAWGRKAVVACRAPVEVRPFHRRRTRRRRLVKKNPGLMQKISAFVRPRQRNSAHLQVRRRRSRESHGKPAGKRCPAAR